MNAALTGGSLRGLTLRELASQAGDPECLNLSTLHSAKGTEYPVVILIGMDEGILPKEWVRARSRDEAEGRRLFFVGVSRAKDELHILHSKESPSRYVKELKQRLSSK